MIKLVKENVLLPLLTRAGTASGFTLMAMGIHETAANQIVLGGIAAVLVVFDLGASWVGRQLSKRKAVANGDI